MGEIDGKVEPFKSLLADSLKHTHTQYRGIFSVRERKKKKIKALAITTGNDAKKEPLSKC